MAATRSHSFTRASNAGIRGSSRTQPTVKLLAHVCVWTGRLSVPAGPRPGAAVSYAGPMGSRTEVFHDDLASARQQLLQAASDRRVASTFHNLHSLFAAAMLLDAQEVSS